MGYAEIRNLDTIMNGALTERFHKEFVKLLDNVYDPNTSKAAVRKITMTVTVKPDPKLETAVFGIEVKTTLAAPVPMTQTVFIHQNDDGGVSAVEQTNAMPGQITLDGDIIIPNVIAFPRNSDAK